MAARLPRFTSTLLQSAVRLAPNARLVVRAPAAAPSSVRAFTQSAATLKKKAAVDDFDEFEEDDLSDFEAASEDAQTQQTQSIGTDAGAKYQLARDVLERALSQPHYAFRSNLPPVRYLTSVILTTSSADVDSTLSLLAKWRARDLPLPPAVNKALLSKFIALGEPHAYVKALVNRTVYGLELDTPRAIDGLLLRLSKPTVAGVAKSEAELEEDLLAVDELRRVLELRPRGELDPIAKVALFSLASRRAASEEVAQQALEQLKALNPKIVGSRLAGLNSPNKWLMRPKLHEIEAFAAQKGDKAGAEWAKGALAQL